MDEASKAKGRKMLGEWFPKEGERMITDNEVALHTVLSIVVRPRMKTKGLLNTVEYLESRLNEIQAVVEKRVLANALDKVS